MPHATYLLYYGLLKSAVATSGITSKEGNKEGGGGDSAGTRTEAHRLPHGCATEKNRCRPFDTEGSMGMAHGGKGSEREGCREGGWGRGRRRCIWPGGGWVGVKSAVS